MTTPGTITDCFQNQVRHTPDHPAILEPHRQLTYRQLDALACTIAGQFPAAPAFVGVVLDHGAQMIASILAVLQAGGAYVPAEPDFPPRAHSLYDAAMRRGFHHNPKKICR